MRPGVTLWIALSLGGLLQSAEAQDRATQNIERRIQRVVELTNAERVKRGLPPLKRQKNLCESATWHAQDMAKYNYFGHEDKMGRNLRARIADFGYERYRALAENIAAGQNAPTEAVTGWVKSPAHSMNLFSPAYREIGVGYTTAASGSYECYWVQDFGMRSKVYPVVINEEKAETDTPKVHLYVYGQEWATLVRFSNDGKVWTKWEPFAPEKDWNLESGEGIRTVYVELQNEDGDTLSTEDAIELKAKSAGTSSETPKPKPKEGAVPPPMKETPANPPKEDKTKPKEEAMPPKEKPKPKDDEGVPEPDVPDPDPKKP